jgi:hypothetical protein
MIYWPAGFSDKVNVDGFGYSIGDNLVRTTMDTGPYKTRKRFTKQLDKMSVRMVITKSQYPTFRTFYDVTLASGSLAFRFNNPLTGVEQSYKFNETPSVSSIGGDYLTLDMKWIDA